MIAVLGIDLGKNSCSLAGFDESGAVVMRRRVARAKLAAFVERLPVCVVAMEVFAAPVISGAGSRHRATSCA